MTRFLTLAGRDAWFDLLSVMFGFYVFVSFAFFIFFARQASEQYKTSFQFLAHALRHVMVREHTAHSLLGRDCLLPLKSFFMGMYRCVDVSGEQVALRGRH